MASTETSTRSTGKPKIVVLGSVNMDLVATMTRMPEPGETVKGTAFLLREEARAPIRRLPLRGLAQMCGWWAESAMMTSDGLCSADCDQRGSMWGMWQLTGPM